MTSAGCRVLWIPVLMFNPASHPAAQFMMPNGYGMPPGFIANGKMPAMQPGYMNAVNMQYPWLQQPNTQTGYDGITVPSQWNGQDGLRWNGLQSLETGDDGTLIPALVPQPGETFEFRNIPLDRDAECEWNLETVLTDNSKSNVDRRVARLDTDKLSRAVGLHKVHVSDMSHNDLFTIRRSKHKLNLFRRRPSYRIFLERSRHWNKDVQFTVNRDIRREIGWLYLKERWRIYRGRQRDDSMIYLCVGSSKDFEYKFYRNRYEYENNPSRPIAEISPDRIRVNEGVDSALILAVSTIIDIAHGGDGSGFLARKANDASNVLPGAFAGLLVGSVVLLRCRQVAHLQGKTPLLAI